MAGGIGGLVNIGMIGGSPLMKVRQVIGERLPLTKSLDGGGGLGGMMQQVLSGGGMSALLPNPMQAAAAQLQAKIGQAVSQLGESQEAAGLTSALAGPGGLASATMGLLSAGNGLLTGSGVLGMVSHGTMAEMAGAALPPGLGIDVVLAPLTADAPLAAAAAAVLALTADVLAGTLDPTAAAIEVHGHTLALNGIAQGSAAALNGLSALAPNIAAVSTVAAAFVSAPPAISAVLERSLGPEAAQIMRASVAAHTDTDEPEAS